MMIGHICSRQLVTIDADQSSQAAAARMRERHVGTLVVTQGAHGRREVVGIVTDRDLVVTALAADPPRPDLAVARAMTRRLVAVPETADLGEVAATMREEGVRRVFVVDAAGGLAGIASLDDLIDAWAGELRDIAKALKTGLAREKAARPTAPPGPAAESMPSLPSDALAARWRQVTSP